MTWRRVRERRAMRSVRGERGGDGRDGVGRGVACLVRGFTRVLADTIECVDL